MNLLKTTLTCAILSICSLSSLGQQASDKWHLDISHTNGKHVYLEVNDELSLKIHKGELVISTKETQSAIYNIEDVKNFSYTQNPNAYVTSPTVSPDFSIGKDYIIINNCGSDGYITIYDLSGKIVCTRKCKENLRINLSDFVKGIYIVDIKNVTTIKFNVR